MSDQQKEKDKEASAEVDKTSEFSVLDEFCRGIGYEEIEFNSWCSHHSSLDLIFTLPIPRDLIVNGYSTEIVMSRTVTTQGPKGKVKTKEKVRHQIIVPPNAEDGHRIVVKGGGDQETDQHGDLIVSVRIS